MSPLCIVRGGRLVDAPARRGERRDILIDGDTIREIGAPGLAAPADATVIDATDRLLIPGLVNAHTHSHSNLSRSTGDRWPLELLLSAGPLTRGRHTHDDRYLSALLGAVEMVRKGCTACYDLYGEFPAPSIEGMTAVAQAYADVGMRAVIAPMWMDVGFYAGIPGLLAAIPDDLRPAWEAAVAGPKVATERTLDLIGTALRGWPYDRFQVGLAVAPTVPILCSDDLLVRLADFARDAGIGLHTHVAESKVQAVVGLKKYGRTITAHLEKLGVLGPNFTAAHAVWVDDDDLKRLADSGSRVAHNPGSNMRLGNGIAAVRRMADRGVEVGIGTDGRTSSDHQNMFEAMRLAAFSARLQGPDRLRWLGADEVFAMATQGGARTLGFGDAVGTIASGAKADIVFLDAHNLNYVPLNDVTNQIVFAEDATGVASVMIGGRMIVDNGRVTTVDTSSLAFKAASAVDRLRSGVGPGAELARKLEPVVASFCGGLAENPYHVHRYTGDDG